MPKNDQIWPKTGIFGQFWPGHAGLFSALLVGRLVVVARGLYLARHLFNLFSIIGNVYFLFESMYSFRSVKIHPRLLQVDEFEVIVQRIIVLCIC